MNLSPVKLECMKLGADKTLSFGCVVKCPEGHGFIIFDDGKILYDIHISYDKIITIHKNTLLSNWFDVIGHPITRGRLAYMYWIDCLNEGLRNKYVKMEVFCNQNPEIYNQTILDRPDEFCQDYILPFLLSVHA